jgi:hypothetical protein
VASRVRVSVRHGDADLRGRRPPARADGSMRLLRWRCRSCSAPWATSMPGETRCPFCGSQNIEGPVNARRARIMDVQRKVRRNGTPPQERVHGRAYSTSGKRRRAVSIDPHADAGKVRPPATSAKAPLRPSKGPLVAFLAALSPCPGPRRQEQHHGNADGESTNMGPRNGKLRRQGVGDKGLTASSRLGMFG